MLWCYHECFVIFWVGLYFEPLIQSYIVIVMAHVQPIYFDTDASIKQKNKLKDNRENVIFIFDWIKYEEIDLQTVEKKKH